VAQEAKTTLGKGERLFGTDGVRGEAGLYPLDPETVESIGYILGQVLIRDRAIHNPVLIIGWDGRESGPGIVASLDAGFRRSGGTVMFAGLIPTPGIAFLTRVRGAAAGISVSASHNPYQDNGIKIFSSTGEKLPAAEELEIEERLIAGGDRRSGGFPKAPHPPEADPALVESYLKFLSESDGNPDLRGLKILVDAANGAASEIAPRLFETLGAQVIVDAAAPNGRNINDGVGALHPGRLSSRVMEVGADLGIALDGDADRLVMVDATGGIWDGDDLLYLCADALLREGKLSPKLVVATVMSNFALESSLAAIGVELDRTPVGDKWVWAEMVRRNAQIGGEQSGHLIFRPLATTGDGLLAAMRVADIVVASKRPMAELRVLRKLPQLMKNVRVGRRVSFDQVPQVAEEIAAAERRLAGRGRVLVRYSGTEPLIRVMAEGANVAEVEEIVDLIVHSIENTLSNGKSAAWN